MVKNKHILCTLCLEYSPICSFKNKQEILQVISAVTLIEFESHFNFNVCVKCLINLKFVYKIQQKFASSIHKFLLKSEGEKCRNMEMDLWGNVNMYPNNECLVCRKTVLPQYMELHVKQHFETKLFCDICNITLNNITDYKSHCKWAKHPQINYYCFECKATFAYKAFYKLHISKHAKIKSETDNSDFGQNDENISIQVLSIKETENESEVCIKILTDKEDNINLIEKEVIKKSKPKLPLKTNVKVHKETVKNNDIRTFEETDIKVNKKETVRKYGTKSNEKDNIKVSKKETIICAKKRIAKPIIPTKSYELRKYETPNKVKKEKKIEPIPEEEEEEEEEEVRYLCVECCAPFYVKHKYIKHIKGHVIKGDIDIYLLEQIKNEIGYKPSTIVRKRRSRNKCIGARPKKYKYGPQKIRKKSEIIEEEKMNKRREMIKKIEMNKKKEIMKEIEMNKKKEIIKKIEMNKKREIIKEIEMNKKSEIMKEIEMNKKKEIEMNKKKEIIKEIEMNKKSEIVEEIEIKTSTENVAKVTETQLIDVQNVVEVKVELKEMHNEEVNVVKVKEETEDGIWGNVNDLIAAAENTINENKIGITVVQKISCGTCKRKYVDLNEHKCPKRNVLCEYCGVIKPISTYRDHFFTKHSNLKLFKCNQCTLQFNSPRQLHTHKARHNPEKKFICQYCGKNFSRFTGMRQHLRQHTNEAPYKCDICNEAFKQNVLLRRHKSSKHNIFETPICACDKCGKEFSSHVALDSHIHRVHP